MGSQASDVAYSGCDPTSRYSREPFSIYVLVDRAEAMIGWNIIIAVWLASHGASAPVTLTPYSVSMPKIRAKE